MTKLSWHFPKLRNKRFIALISLFFLFSFSLALVFRLHNSFFFEEKAEASVLIGDDPVTKTVFLLVFNPIIESQGSQKLTTYKSWNDPDALNAEISPALHDASHGFVTYEIVERQEIDGWPAKSDGFVYDDASYLQCLDGISACHVPDLISYQELFSDYDICSKNVDEVWIWGGPYFGFHEFELVPDCGNTTFVMGFNYERNLGEALHDFGHRMEHVNLARINNGIAWEQNDATVWNTFSMINGHCGNIHYPPGTSVPSDEYNYAKTTSVTSDCLSYENYPAGPFVSESLTCIVWECTQEGFVKWWLSNIPFATGTSIDPQTGQAIYNNWWKYYAYFDQTADGVPTPTPTPRDLDPYLIGYWNLNETSGTTLNDTSGNNRNATVTGTTSVAGIAAAARRMDGSADIITVSDHAAFSGMEEFSISLWVRPEDTSSYDTLVCKQTGSAPYSYCLFWVPEFQKIAFRVNSDGNDLMSPNNSAPRNTWTHVVATYKGATGEEKIYINGVLCQGCSQTISSGNVGTNTSNLVFGSRYGGEVLTGALDEIRIYNTTLNAGEVAELYATPGPTSTPTPTQAPTSTPTPTLTPTPTRTPTPTPTSAPITVTLNPVADAYVRSNSQNSNYGTATTLVTDNSPIYQSFLKYNLTPYAGKTLLAATFRVKIGSDSSSGTQSVYPVSNNTWTETGLKYSNKPAFDSPALGTFVGNSKNSWKTVNVQTYLSTRMGQTVSFGIGSSSSDSMNMSSREGSSSNRPQLVLTYQ